MWEVKVRVGGGLAPGSWRVGLFMSLSVVSPDYVGKW